VDGDFRYDELLDDCSIQFSKYVFNQKHRCSFLILNCLVDTSTIGPSFEVRIYNFDIDEEFRITTHLLVSRSFNRPVIGADIVTSTVIEDEFVFVVQMNERNSVESIIFIAEMKCDSATECLIQDEHTYTGQILGINTFIVNTFMFIEDNPMI